VSVDNLHYKEVYASSRSIEEGHIMVVERSSYQFMNPVGVAVGSEGAFRKSSILDQAGKRKKCCGGVERKVSLDFFSLKSHS
jgi:hypothetical protein